MGASNNMRIKAVLFDFDGTLADTLPVCFYAFRRIFKELDHREITDNEIVSMFGPSETGIIQENLKKSESVEEAINKYYTYYEEVHSSLVKKNTNIHDLLKWLKSMDIKVGIVTGKARKSLDISMEKLEMDHMFDVIITGDDVDRPKPHPEGILKAISSLEVVKEQTIFVGDSHADIKAGKDAGIITIGVLWLPTVQSLTFEPSPDYLFKNTFELVNLIKSL
jgi:pyrophosphatase PpaX